MCKNAIQLLSLQKSRNAFSESRKPRTQRRAHDTLHDVFQHYAYRHDQHERRFRGRNYSHEPSDAQEAIPGLPNHLVTAHIIRSKYFDNPPILHGSQR